MSRELRGPSMLALVEDLTAPALWRTLQPFKALEQRGYPCGWALKDHRAAPRLAERYAGLLLARVSWARAARPLVERAFAEARAAGRFVIYDCDDDLFRPEIIAWQREVGLDQGKTERQLETDRQDRIWALQAADGVTVSTEPLAALCRSLTDRPVIVVPNAIDVSWFRSVVRATTRQISGVTIGWAGGARPDADLIVMADAWARIARRYPRVTFVVQGHLPKILERAVPADRLRWIAWMPLDRYPEGLAQVDIACCSVADTDFSRCKTPIKAYEAAVAGSAVVATPTLYGPLIEHGRTGYLAETVDDWEHALAALIDSGASRLIMARRLLRVVERRWSLRENLAHWPAAWSVIADTARKHHAWLVTA